MNKTMRLHADLALTVSLDLVCERKRGRLDNLLNTLTKECVKILKKTPKMGYTDKGVIANKINDFQTITGWKGKDKHTATYIKFLLEIHKQYDYEKVTKILKELYGYFARVDRIPAPCIWSGITAFEKWEKITQE